MNLKHQYLPSTDPNRNVTQRQRRATLFTNDLQEEIPEGPEEVEHEDGQWERLSVKSHNLKSSSSGSEPNDCWFTNPHLCDGNSAAAQRKLAIVAHSSGNISDILKASKTRMFVGVPIEKNLTKLHKKLNGKGDNTNIASIVADLEKERSDILSAILDVPSSSGPQARDKLLTAFDLLFGLTTSHRLIIYAIMCYI